MRARRLRQAKKFLPLLNVGRKYFIQLKLKNFDKSEVTSARLPDIERFPFRIDS